MGGARGYPQPPKALSEHNFIQLKKGCSQHPQVPGSVPETGPRTKMCTLPSGQFRHGYYRTSQNRGQGGVVERAPVEALGTLSYWFSLGPSFVDVYYISNSL